MIHQSSTALQPRIAVLQLHIHARHGTGDSPLHIHVQRLASILD